MHDENIKNVIKEKLGLNEENINEIEIYNKFIYNDIIYTSSSFKTNYCDSSFITKENKLGIIHHLFTYNNKDYVISKRLLCLCYPFLSSQSNINKVSICFCDLTDDFFIEEIINIKKTVLIQVDNKIFISTFSISHLYN